MVKKYLFEIGTAKFHAKPIETLEWFIDSRLGPSREGVNQEPTHQGVLDVAPLHEGTPSLSLLDRDASQTDGHQ